MAEPPIRIVSEQEITEREARDRVSLSLRILSPNIMRIARGTGRPNYLWSQLEDCMKTLQHFF